MISKVTLANRDLIDARLKEINLALAAAAEKEGRTNPTVLHSLEDYYANIIEISQLKTKFHDAPYKYFLMPLDEPLFEIDANKRTITVPAHFSKNGVGVHGDHMAEILYFRVDKYFDYQDLFNVDDIIINWQFRPSNASRNAELKTYTSRALAPDDTYDPGHIVFGWVIGNFIEEDEDGVEQQYFMTPSRGTLTFSVSFLKHLDNEYKYVLNTQTASVNINDSLVLDNPQRLNYLNRPVFSRLSNSRYTPENITPLEDPIYRTAPKTKNMDGKPVIEYRGLPDSMNFVMEADGSEPNPIILQTIGYSSDDGYNNIKYTWYKNDLEEPIALPDRPTTKDDYVLTSDIAPQAGVRYYIINNNEIKQLEADPANEDDISLAEAFADPNVAVYELGSHLEVTVGGSYQVVMQSEKEVGQDSEKITLKSGSVPSDPCVIPRAAKPKIHLDVTSKVNFDNEEKFETGNLIKDDPEEAENYIFVDGESPEVFALISIDEDAVYNIETHTGIPGVTKNSSIGAVYLELVDKDFDIAEVNLNNYSEESVTYRIPDKETSRLSIESNSTSAEGIYKVFGINKRNRTYTLSDASNEINVSKVAPILTELQLKALKQETEEEDQLVLSDTNTYVVDPKQPVQIANETRDFEIIIGDTLDPNTNTEFEVIEVNKTGDDIIPLDEDYNEDGEVIPNRYEVTLRDGHYYFSLGEGGRFVIQAKTHYNGTQRMTISAPFVVSKV